MKKLFTFIAVICLAVNASAQFQVANSDFESWTASSGEPDHWHGFKSASGGLAGSARGTLESSTDKHSGTYSALITAGSVFGIVNNGTFTTGQLNAGNISATNTANHAHMDVSSTKTDANGDRFYMPFTGHPDAMVFWYKFTQGTAQSTYKYASANAVIFDGSYYQDPEDKTYTNVVAKAGNKTITTTTSWTELIVPFEYTSNNVTPQAILVTFGTNATPGKGSDGDKVWIDDLEFLYYCELTSAKYDGSDVVFTNGAATVDAPYDASKLTDLTSSGHGATIEKSYNKESAVLTITVKGEDISENANNFNTYTIQFLKKGDVNKDKQVTIADVTALVNMILGKAGENELADVNNDGGVTIADVTALVNIILGKN